MVWKSFFFFFLNITPQAGARTCARVLFVPALLPAGWSSVPGCSPAAVQSEHHEASDRQFIARSTLCCEKSQIWAMCKAQLSLSFCESWLQGEKIRVLRSDAFLPFFRFLHTAQMQWRAERRVLRLISPTSNTRCLHSFIHAVSFNVSSKSQWNQISKVLVV